MKIIFRIKCFCKWFIYRWQTRDIVRGWKFNLLADCLTFPLLALAFPAVIIVRLLRPLVLVRFGGLSSRRIGPFATVTETYLCYRQTKEKGRRRIWDVFYFLAPVCNRQLKKMWQRKLNIFSFAKWLERANSYLPGGERHALLSIYGKNVERDIDGLLASTPPRLSFTAREEAMGLEALRGMGLPANAPFICFFARDSAYLDSIFPGADFSYQNYRDSRIDNYLPAARELAERGYYLFRMGALVKNKLNSGHPRVIDYASKFRNDFLDIYLAAKCRFFLGDSAGLASVAQIFRRPIAWVNCIPIERVPSWNPGDLFITKKLWLRNDRRFMRLSEIISSGAGNLEYTELYDERGIEVLENTPEEIRDLAVEMDLRIKGAWQGNEEDEALQSRFWALLKSSKLPHGNIFCRFGAAFLRQNREFLA